MQNGFDPFIGSGWLGLTLSFLGSATIKISEGSRVRGDGLVSRCVHASHAG
jgi:hypothetical protein